MSLCWKPNSCAARSRASCTAFLVNDRKPISHGEMPRDRASLMICISRCVFPQPGGPRIKVLFRISLPHILLARSARAAMQPLAHLLVVPPLGGKRVVLPAKVDWWWELLVSHPFVDHRL